MLKRELKRFRLKVERLFEPFGLIALAILLTLPVLTVLNLDTHVDTKNTNVLGVQSEPGIGVALVGGIHNIFEDESIEFITEDVFKYVTILRQRDKGVYSKPVLQVTNNSSKDTTITVSGGTGISTDSDIYVILNNQKYLLQNSIGRSYEVQFELEGSAKGIIYVLVDSKSKVLFDEGFEIRVK